MSRLLYQGVKGVEDRSERLKAEASAEAQLSTVHRSPSTGVTDG